MIIYKTLSSNISATTQYNDFVWGDEWGNIWGVGYSTEMSTIMTRVKPISSQTLSHITTKRATDKKIAATTKVYNQIKREAIRLVTSLSKISSLITKPLRLQKQIVAITKVYNQIKRWATRLVTSLSKISSLITKSLRLQKQIAAITNTSNKIIDNVKKIILSMSVIMLAKNIKGYRLLAAGVNTVSINGKRLIKALLNSIETFCSFSFKEVTRITIITSATVNSLIRRNLFKTITMNTNTQSVKTTKSRINLKVVSIINSFKQLNVKKYINTGSNTQSVKTAKSRIILKAVNIINSFKQLNVKKYINTGLNTCTVKTIKTNKIFIHTLNLVSSFTKNIILTYIKELSSVLIVNISTKKHIKKLIAVIVDMLNLKNVKTFKLIEAIITAYETINKIINSTIKGITTTLALTSKGIKKSINVISNILSVEIYNLRFIKILSTAISVVTSILAKFKPVVIDVIFKLGIPKNIIFNLTENQDIAFTLTQDNDVTIQADDITDIAINVTEE